MRPLLLTFAAAALLATSPVSAEESPPAEAGPRLDAPRSIESPPAPSTIRSPAMTIAGSIASGIGLGAIIAGAALWADAEGEAEACYRDSGSVGLLSGVGCSLGEALPKATAAGLFVTGGLHLAAGIPLLAVGASPRSAEDRPEVIFSLAAGRADLAVHFD